MHVVFREAHNLEDGAGLDGSQAPYDPGQDAADLVVMSFSDSDLGAFAAAWHGSAGQLPSLRLVNLVALRHPLSVDAYVARTLAGARAILIRLIGGESYWSYGLAEVSALARRRAIALAVLPADGREDAVLDGLSTLPVPMLRHLAALCDQGGVAAAQSALCALSQVAGLEAAPQPGAQPLPAFGWYDPENGAAPEPVSPDGGPPDIRPPVVIVFYRSYLTSADTAPIDALMAALKERGFRALGLFVPSLKAARAGAWVAAALRDTAPVAIVNATAFSAQGGDGAPSPLDAAGCPVFQVALSTARRREWAAADRGLSPSDLAMHVVLPEIDGRVFAGVVSFKSPGRRDPDLQFSRFIHRPDAGRIAAVADRVAAWHRLARTPAPQRQLALVLSTYPGKDYQMAHAVGLDTLASCRAMFGFLAREGYDIGPGAPLAEALATATLDWPLEAYAAALARLPEALRAAVMAAWGAPETDPALAGGAFRFRALRRGKALVALQPERGDSRTRADTYHDLRQVPCHGYIAFHLWLRAQAVHALVHIGAHGTLEWLPGKAVALSQDCWPDALVGALPVIYPFIVNDPGEAAQAKRRIAAVTLGHLPPPLSPSSVPRGLIRLEQLLDEYATADGLDPGRRGRLIDGIRAEAQSAGVEADLGLAAEAAPAEAIARIDRFVCDIKESQFGDGLHVFGEGPCGPAEQAGLIAALDGKRVDAGPSGSPFRGRDDVMPTGRNLFSVDPRAVPSRMAHSRGIALAEELLRRHLQDHGDYPRGLLVDLWGSATMRTAGEEFAMALHLAGVAPLWDGNSERLTGFEIMPLAELGRPRIDVTLRISGLFRDVFPGLVQIFDAASTALGRRDFEAGENPYLARSPRVFGPRPAEYGLALGPALDDYSPAGRAAAGEAWLAGSQWAFDAEGARPARAALEARVLAADSFVHVQDLPETDVLLAADYGAHEGGFAAAVARLGGAVPSLYHLDTTRPATPRARHLSEEIARVVRARAADPAWATGMMRHGFRGAAEIAATLDHLAAFAHLARIVPPHLFDLYHEATLERPELVDFMQSENPHALAALRSRFIALRDAGLWLTRRNAIASALEDQR